MGFYTILNEDATAFARWLENRPQSAEIVVHPSGDLLLTVQRACVRHTPTGTVVVERSGVYRMRNDDPDGPTWLLEFLGPVIWFELLPLSGHVEVHGDCEYSGAEILFITTLARIAQVWPHAREAVLAYLEEVARIETGSEWWDHQVRSTAQALRAELLAQQEAEQGKPQPDPEPASTEAGGEAVGEWAGKPGHPGLSHEELIYRLAKAQEAEAIRASSEKQGETKAWREIAQEIGWKYGYSEKGLALLRDARQRLRRVVNARDEELLQQIAEF